jgi:hypothetical protein
MQASPTPENLMQANLTLANLTLENLTLENRMLANPMLASQTLASRTPANPMLDYFSKNIPAFQGHTCPNPNTKHDPKGFHADHTCRLRAAPF